MMDRVVLPNVRKLFIPDPGYMMLDADLSGADAQVFAKETGDEPLLEDFRQGRDIHTDNATWMRGEAFTSLPKESPLRYKWRQQCKHAVHALHNVGSDRALTGHPSISWTSKEAAAFRAYWFGKHPRIPAYFRELEVKLRQTRTVSNRFGYRIIYFDRIDSVLPQAIPWVNQSTVAETCFRGALQLEAAFPWVEILIQVHDSLVFQIPFRHAEPGTLTRIKETLKVPVPYPDPLIIPWKLSMSEKSWGDCQEVEV